MGLPQLDINKPPFSRFWMVYSICNLFFLERGHSRDIPQFSATPGLPALCPKCWKCLKIPPSHTWPRKFQAHLSRAAVKMTTIAITARDAQAIGFADQNLSQICQKERWLEDVFGWLEVFRYVSTLRTPEMGLLTHVDTKDDELCGPWREISTTP